ncbi:hypothetical protein C7T35_01450 [Variovorax sp. WS11]|uniref:hypothetical protein n=1 Tax=Variovorax sp. WS11 TaxID=1105204 RepID=UPI000D0D309F|nr:hypothetical protein [Variovorax sp. WS11]NDZ11482.1 hypothetical protein [Variovorax sp. WS11]PSL86660.1 hypothetical protein C7T35_01450 [Variovorax sp. WS11]
MATAPIPPGGIVSVPDPVTGGAGAPTIVSQIINANWANGISLLNRAFVLSDDAINIADPAPQLTAPVLDTTYLPALKPELPENNPADAKAIYDDARLEIDALIQGGYVDFLNTYFPDGPYYTAALAWLERAIVDGGTGINVGVEQQLWERARSRLGIEADRATNDALQGFANRGFPLPPGALVHQVKLIDQDRRDKLAEQSRDISIEAFRAELENTRFAVTHAIDLRMKAIAAAGDYIRTLVLGPQTAMQLATSMVGLRTDLARSLVALYSAETAALEPRVRLAIQDADIKLRGQEANLRAKSQAIEDRARAALSNAQMVASAAAASLNGINASAGISGSDSTSS